MTGIPSILEGTAPENKNPAEQKQTYGDQVEAGVLLTGQPEEVFTDLKRKWHEQVMRYRRWIAEWEVNERRRSGECNVWAVKRQDKSQWEVYVPPGLGSVPPAVFNKADRLCQRLVSQVYADPPVAEAVPSTGDDDDRDAAEVATRVLLDVQSDAGVNEPEVEKVAFDQASSFGSGYVRYFVNPTGGGRNPIQIDAHPSSQTVEDATFNPASGMPHPPDELEKRYVTPEGQLQDQEEGAALKWTPKLEAEVLTAGQVRFWPATARDVWDADGILIASYRPWKTLVEWYPELSETADEDRDKATQYRLDDGKYLLPKLMWKPHDPPVEDPNERLALHLLFYAKECPDYPDGVEVATVGNALVVKQGEWVDASNGMRRPMDLPVSQFKQFRGERDNPHGLGLMGVFGPASEFRAMTIGQFSDMVDRAANLKTYLPTTSIAQAKQANAAFDSFIPIQPGTEPYFEKPPPIPGELVALFNIMSDEMNDASTMQETGQGLQTESVQSGRQALAIQGQVQVGQSDLRQNAERGFIRSCRIQLQLIRQGYQTPTLLRYMGEDGDYKVQHFLGSDLGTTSDVRVKPGTLSMMSPQQKMAQALQYATLPQPIIAPEDLKGLVSASLGPQLGIQDDPQRMRVRQQVAKWEQGPPQGWMPPPPPGPASVQPSPMGPQIVPAPPPIDPVMVQLFDPRPSDLLPDVAPMRLRELGRCMAGQRFAQFPPGWQVGLIQEFERMHQVVFPPMMPQPQVPEKPGRGKKPPQQNAQQKPQLTPSEQAMGAGQ